MKINVLRYLVLPWFLFFLLIVAAIFVANEVLHLPPAYLDPYYLYVLVGGSFVCLFANFQTLSKAGIWLAESLPKSLRLSSWGWVIRATVASLVALSFYFFGELQWVPLIWQGAVIPVVFSAALFVIVWSLMGPILTWASQIAFSRFTAFFLSIPVFALVPITAVFLGNIILNAYHASQPERPHTVSRFLPATAQEQIAVENNSAAAKETPLPLTDKSALAFKTLAESGKPCYEETKAIQAALNVKGSEDNVYWAIKAIKCTDMKSVNGLPKLTKLMVEHSSPRVRAAAIRALPKFGTENVRRVGYLLVKRINDREPAPVIDAATYVLSRAGDEERKIVTNRLKGLLENPQMSSIVAKVLVENLKRGDLVGEYVSAHLHESSAARDKAISMICSLPVENRKMAEPYIDNIVASIKTGDQNDPGIAALGCLGEPGVQAIRQEVLKPQRLSRPVAARALASINVKNDSQTLQTVANCSQDSDAEVRNWCSQTLGKIGAPALSQILDLLKSNKVDLKNSGKNAMSFFADPSAKPELIRIRAENSGWMADRRKLQIATAVDYALAKISVEEAASDTKNQEADEKAEVPAPTGTTNVE